jgi:hypothetical protein
LSGIGLAGSIGDLARRREFCRLLRLRPSVCPRRAQCEQYARPAEPLRNRSQAEMFHSSAAPQTHRATAAYNHFIVVRGGFLS